MDNRKVRILVVDDSKESREVCQRVLRKEGYEVQGVDNGKKALDELKATRFDLIITDLKMPEVDGISLLKKAKEIYPEIFVIVMTGYPDEESRIQAIKAGASDYLAKPIEVSDLITTVKRCLKYR
jgi:DNA-binding NtrC family response regulator